MGFDVDMKFSGYEEIVGVDPRKLLEENLWFITYLLINPFRAFWYYSRKRKGDESMTAKTRKNKNHALKVYKGELNKWDSNWDIDKGNHGHFLARKAFLSIWIFVFPRDNCITFWIETQIYNVITFMHHNWDARINNFPISILCKLFLLSQRSPSLLLRKFLKNTVKSMTIWKKSSLLS